jgi:hypothetical protein
MNQATEASRVMHEMTALVQLNANVDPVDHKSGMHGGPNPDLTPKPRVKAVDATMEMQLT